MTEIAKPGEEQRRIVVRPFKEEPAPAPEPEPVEEPEYEEVEACTCTVACIPQGIMEEQTCKESLV